MSSSHVGRFAQIAIRAQAAPVSVSVGPHTRAGSRLWLDDPLSRYYRDPLAKRLVGSVLVKTSVMPHHLALVSVIAAAAAGYLVTFGGARYSIAAALIFEAHAIFDSAQAALTRAKNLGTSSGLVLGVMGGWLGLVALVVGIGWRFHLHAPAGEAWNAYASTTGLLLFALAGSALLRNLRATVDPRLDLRRLDQSLMSAQARR